MALASDPDGAEHAARSFFRRGERQRSDPGPGLSVGKVVGDYRLVAWIGQGGMGQVWEAEQLSLRRHVAVKFVRPEQVTERQLELFAREARAGGRLQHPNIVTVHGHGTSDGLAWIAMEFVEGAWTLKDFLDDVVRSGEVARDHDHQVARFAAEVADALQAAHDVGVIHRDVKPHNVLVTPDDRPKLTDFGLARITDEEALSHTGDMAGSYFYMSPEQVTARRMGIDHRTDVFSLGVVLYELLALQRPFQGDTEHQVAQQIVTKDPPDPRFFRSRVPRDLAVIVGKALEKDRDKRFPTAGAMAADLRRFLASQPIHARPPSRVDRAVKWVRRNPARSMAAAVAAAAFLVISGLLVETRRARDELSLSNRALSAKTTESEARRAQADEWRGRAERALEAATQRADEVLRLSTMPTLEDLVREAEGLWPAHPRMLAAYEDWLRRANELCAELPDFRSTLAELRARALPPDPGAGTAAHPRSAEYEHARRELAFREAQTRAAAGSSSAERERSEPGPVDVGVVLADLPADATEVNELAWGLVDPGRLDWGEEAKGLVLARRALEMAADLDPVERAEIRDTLAWALFANGRFGEALAEAERSLADVPEDTKLVFESYLRRLRAAIAALSDPATEVRRAAELAKLRERVERLASEVGPWRFADRKDQWWHDQLVKLVTGIEDFSDPETGLVLGRTIGAQGWSVARRAQFARSIVERSVSGADAAARWADAIEAIADVSRSPHYGSLRITPQLGLLPIGADPRSGLWEFAHLETGEPAVRDAGGDLRLEEATGLVLVLLPAGRFVMGGQSLRADGPNFDPGVEDDEGPVRETSVAAFFLSKYEMTQAQWLRFTGQNPSQYEPGAYDMGWNQDTEPGNLVHPVERVSWNACRTVLARLDLDLPTEAEWEYGARAGTTTIWWCGDDPEALQGTANVADAFAKEHGAVTWTSWERWDDGNTAHATVGSYEPNPFGLHDTIGNVNEWCLDLYVAGDGQRVVRGGSFGFAAASARSASRDPNPPDDVDENIGVRPARRLDP